MFNLSTHARHSARLGLLLAATMGMVVPSGARAQVPHLWQARFSAFKGDTSCSYGDADCNRCVYDVREQFEAITQRSEAKISLPGWQWEESKDYPPDALAVDEVLHPDIRDGRHFQGFSRVATDVGTGAPAFVASYGGPQAGLFLIDIENVNGRPTGSGQLAGFRASTVSHHPAGLQGVGHVVLVPHNEAPDGSAGAIEFVDLHRALGNDEMPFVSLPHKAKAVGGVKVAGGGYLVLSRSEKRELDLFYTNSLTSPHLERVWQPVLGFESWPHSERSPESISMVTECGTGDIYVVMVGGRGAYVDPIKRGDWLLYRLDPGPELTHVATNTRDMHSAACDTRAASGAFAGRHGELALYCHQKSSEVDIRHDLIACGTGGVVGRHIVPRLAASIFGVPFGMHADPTWPRHCFDAASPDESVVFTEYWPLAPTPESPPRGPTRRLRIELEAHFADGLGVSDGRVGLLVVDADTGRSCQVVDAAAHYGPSATVCEWEIDQGQDARLFVPMRTGTRVVSGPCVQGEETCTIPMTSDVTLRLYRDAVPSF